MSPKGKQARKSQRKKAQEKANQSQSNEEALEYMEGDSNCTLQDTNKKKRPREEEKDHNPTSGTGVEAEPVNKKNSMVDPSQISFVTKTKDKDSGDQNSLTVDKPDHQTEDSSTGDSPELEESGNSEENSTPKEAAMNKEKTKGGNGNINNEVSPSKNLPPPSMGSDQWEQIMSRFDSFESSIKSTIKEEIKINSKGLQKQVKSLGSQLKEVETSISANKSEITKINHKVAELDNLQEMIASEVQKHVSEKVTHLENQLEASKTEIDNLKKGISQRPRQEPDSSTVSRKEFLKEQRFNRTRNLMLMGVGEPKDEEDEKIKVSGILEKRLGIPKLKIDMATRMGASVGKYPRPILISFKHMQQRYQVWYKKGALNKDQTLKLWLQEDLPKPLRNDLNALLKVLKQAKSLPGKYTEVKIKDFRIRIQGRFYSAQELEQLPDDLKPSKSTTPQNDKAVVFFGRASPLSNHHICKFNIAGKTFTCVEHFLAWQRANVAKDKPLAEEVLSMKDPSEHKKVLNSLREINSDAWEESVENILLTALRAKFRQNTNLKKFLCDTLPKKIGEASVNTTWGIGMQLTHDDVLDTTKWNENGNRLGKALEVIRDELVQSQAWRNTHEHSPSIP